MSTTTQNELRRTFIAMLFALVAATVAQQISELLFVVTGGWDSASSPSKMFDNLFAEEGALLATLSHSLLALLLVTISWVMWSKSQAGGLKKEISSIFSKEFVILLVEVFLVVLYFAIVKTVEQNFQNYTVNKKISEYVGVASARPEALQLMWVFAVYFIWDFIVDVVTSPRYEQGVVVPSSVISYFTGVVAYCSISMICLLGAWLVSGVSASVATPYEAVIGDVALLCVLLFFVLAKQLEYHTTKIFPKEATRKNTKRDTPPSVQAYVGMVILIAVYTYLIMVLIWPPSFLR
ncbi:hypothetical protein FJD38_22860 [Pseudomonas saxonica]|uniref:Uncharacterized protein n=1 Tax=Pseudomonas saxonica TaxID=2600598 RepID=A0ABY3GCH0_9PSED|nr:hypothetical protein [Pseudomonas saxonica]TWR85122.1 hypothetical protein FJD38_22860 [Pseudomonas saxonica]